MQRIDISCTPEMDDALREAASTPRIRVPGNANLFLIEQSEQEAFGEIEELARESGRCAIGVDLDVLAKRLDNQLDLSTGQDMISVGASGGRFAQKLSAPPQYNIPITTERFDRDREKRELAVNWEAVSTNYGWQQSPIHRDIFQYSGGVVTPPNNPLLVDDVAVSGKTLRVVQMAVAGVLDNTPTTAVGLLFNSSTTRNVIGVDVMAGATYGYSPGTEEGKPPVNTLASLVAYPDRAEEFAESFFGSNSQRMLGLIDELRVERGQQWVA